MNIVWLSEEKNYQDYSLLSINNLHLHVSKITMIYAELSSVEKSVLEINFSSKVCGYLVATLFYVVNFCC